MAEKRIDLKTNELAEEILGFLNRTVGNSGVEVAGWLRARLNDPVLFGNNSLILALPDDIARALEYLLSKNKIQVTGFCTDKESISVFIKPVHH